MGLALLLEYTGLVLLAYVLGSIPWGVILTRGTSGADIRLEGSGNIGATNVRRIAGTKLGVLTLLGDMLKGAVPVWLYTVWIPPPPNPDDVMMALVVLAAISGHLYPLFLKLKSGGKGVATTAGCFLAASPMASLIALLTFLILILSTNRMSVGSLGATAVLPISVWATTRSPALTTCAAVAAVLVFTRHRDNIRRLRSGTEHRIWERRPGTD